MLDIRLSQPISLLSSFRDSFRNHCVKWRNNYRFWRKSKPACEGRATVLLSCCVHEQNAEQFYLKHSRENGDTKQLINKRPLNHCIKKVVLELWILQNPKGPDCIFKVNYTGIFFPFMFIFNELRYFICTNLPENYITNCIRIKSQGPERSSVSSAP